ncbi:MAG: bifunctional 4-hydroxy-2-oxoglutarate aldolase/2-dehydro-3-deoxy-phosphogluconate aldolase [Gammaproteobacteria bacterium]
MDALSLLKEFKLVPVLVINNAQTAIDLARCLQDAGIGALEITLRTPVALSALEAIANNVEGMLLGAGSIRQAGQFESVKNAGASFAVSPGATDTLVNVAKKLAMPFVPGAVTPSEMLALYEKGYTLQKFFPAELSGGASLLKAVAAPMPELRFFPTGGINAALVTEYSKLPNVVSIGGSWFAPAELIAEKKFSQITKKAKEALSVFNN